MSNNINFFKRIFSPAGNQSEQIKVPTPIPVPPEPEPEPEPEPVKTEPVTVWVVEWRTYESINNPSRCARVGDTESDKIRIDSPIRLGRTQKIFTTEKAAKDFAQQLRDAAKLLQWNLTMRARAHPMQVE